MLEKFKKFIKKLSKEELFQIKKIVEQQINEIYKHELGERTNRRVKLEMPATCIIEREKELDFQEHKIATIDMSTTGILFRTSAAINQDDILDIKFQFPSSSEKKFIDCQVVRIKELKDRSGFSLEVACKALDEETKKDYKEVRRKINQVNKEFAEQHPPEEWEESF